ncbi:MAG TPA: dihydroorotase [Clostridiales bacterium]|nr:dihydroorotase [Clostridiales bacterium]
MRDLLIQNGKVYMDGGFQKLDLLIRGGILYSVAEGVTPSADAEVVNADHRYILPGLADIHVHLREPGFSYKETIATGTAAAARGGFTLVCAMPNLDPVPDCTAHLKLEQEIIDSDARIKVLPYAAITLEEKGETLADMAALADRCAAFSDDGRGVQDPDMMRHAMVQARRLNKVIAAHCEDDRLIPAGACIHDGKYARDHHLPCIPSASEYEPVQRDIALVEETGCRYHICHVSCRESVQAIREAKERGLPVSGETAPHYLAFTEEDLLEEGRFKMNPPLRSRLDQEALIRGIRDGTLEIIATDHAPHSAEEKSRGLRGSLMGVVGLEVSFAAANTYLCKAGHIDLERLVELMSINPRRLLGLPAGIRMGYPADLVIVDPDRKILVNPARFESMGRSTPFEGCTLYGDILLTIYDGDIVYRDTAF